MPNLLGILQQRPFGISFGLSLFGPKLIRMVGNEITKLNPMRAYCVALSAAVTVIIASALGLPVSSTHIAIGAIFVNSGFWKVMELSAFTARMESMGVPAASVTAPLGAFVEFFGGLAIILGAWTWLAALLVAAFTVVATYIAHRFWIMPPEQVAAQQTQFMKNLAITGGLLAFAAAGPGRFSIDGWRWRRENGRYL